MRDVRHPARQPPLKPSGTADPLTMRTYASSGQFGAPRGGGDRLGVGPILGPGRLMALTAGSRLGPYEIAARIGRGGIADVCHGTERLSLPSVSREGK